MFLVAAEPRWDIRGSLPLNNHAPETALWLGSSCMSQGPGNQKRKILRRSLFVALALTIFVGGIAWVRSRAALTLMERKLVGSWIADPSGEEQPPGARRTFTFTSDRRVTGRVVDSVGATVGELMGDKDETWFIDGQTLFIRRGRKGQPSLRDRISGDVFVWEQWPIASLSDDVLVIGNETWGRRFALKPAATSPNRPE
jgi:hypothetical protein